MKFPTCFLNQMHRSGNLLDVGLGQQSDNYGLWIILDQHTMEKQSFTGAHLFTCVHLYAVYGHPYGISVKVSSSNRMYSLQG